MNKKAIAGFTLIEVLISLALLSGIILGTVALIGAVTSARAKTSALQEVGGNARPALSIMQQRIRSASSINSASSTFMVHPGVLSLATSVSSTNPTRFFISGQRLYMQEGSQAATPLISSQTQVTNLVFTQAAYANTAGGVQIDLGLQYTNPQDDPAYRVLKTYQTLVMLRP